MKKWLIFKGILGPGWRLAAVLAPALGLALWSAGRAAADDVPSFALSIQDHKFAPVAMQIPKDTKVKLVVANRDASVEEFESYELNRELVIPAGGERVVFIGPLAAGTYSFFGDMHQDTAQGTLVAQ